MSFETYDYTVAERFLRYTRIDTQSDPQSPSSPSSSKQKGLGKLLATELRDLGLEDAVLDEFGLVYATLPSNSAREVPVICFCAHMDTSPDCSGEGVKPIIHEAYDGRDLVLPDNPEEVLRLKDHPGLAAQLGNDIITASGNTLLGADNKSGVAEIMDAMRYLVNHTEIPHGRLRVLFTVDEEIGRGVDHVDLSRLGARYGYTIDGEEAGSIEDETFCADGARIILHGVPVHTGFAKGKLVNAVRVAAHLLASLPLKTLSPESTSGREGFIHPLRVEGTAEKAVLEFLIRDFTREGLRDHERRLEGVMEEALRAFPGASAELQFHEQYRNMKQILDLYPKVTALAKEAVKKAGLEPRQQSIRGGTDGCRLSFMGLPCPNIFAGEHAFHSRQEWVSIQDMQKAVQTIVYLAMLWESEG